MVQTIKLSEHVNKIIEEEKNECLEEILIPKRDIDNII
jgi:hypothetical protein